VSTQPSKRAPQKIYWVDLVTIGKLRFRQSGGGKFTRLEAAEDRQGYLESQGIESVIFEGIIHWHPLDTEKE
jgi:hypothetical protein